MSFVDIFPPELTEVVFSHLSVPDLVNSSLVCVSWYEASNVSSVWREAIKRSAPKDRFRILSNLDRFNGIASNYDGNHSFPMDRQSPSNLSIMNPWKLSLSQNNFVRRNWSGSHLARHQIEFEDDKIIDRYMRVEYPSKLPQDCLYLPILVLDQPDSDFLLIRLDGTPRIAQKILSTETEITIPIVCIDRDCMIWVQDRHVKYLSFVDNNNCSQIENWGRLNSESDEEEDELCYMMTMNDKYIVAGFVQTFVKLWCKKTKQLKFITKTSHTISNVNCVITDFYLYNERIYFKHCKEGCEGHCNRSFLEIYDIKGEKSLGNTFYSSHIVSIAFNDKYYAIAMLSGSEVFREISVREIETNEVKITLNVNNPSISNAKVWIVDDKVFYIEQNKFKFLSLVDWSISSAVHDPINSFWNNHIWDSFLLSRDGNIVRIWDWELGKKLDELLLDVSLGHRRVMPLNVHNDGTRLVAVGKESINVVGFW